MQALFPPIVRLKPKAGPKDHFSALWGIKGVTTLQDPVKPLSNQKSWCLVPVFVVVFHLLPTQCTHRI